MKPIIALALTLLAAVAPANAAAPAEGERGLAAALYYRISLPAAGEDAGASWGGGAARLRLDWSDRFAFAAAFGYDRHEFGESGSDVFVPGEPLERQLLSFRAGVIREVAQGPVYPYVGGGLTLAREKAYFREGRLEPKVIYHPGLYAEAGTGVPLVGPVAVDVGPELVLLFGKRVAAYRAAFNDYRYDGGAALYVGVKAGVGIRF
jgi:hypothetical protein